MFKLFIAGCRNKAMDVSQMRSHMASVHAPLVMDYIAREPDHAPRQYAQNYVTDVFPGESLVERGRSVRPFEFLTEVCFANGADAKSSTETAFYLEHLRPDEDQFVDQTTVVHLPVLEQVILRGRAERPREKLFVFLGSPAITAAGDFDPVVASHLLSALDHVSHDVARHVRNHVVQTEVDATAVSVIEEFWLKNHEAAKRLAATLSRAESNELHELMKAGVMRIFTAHERVFLTSDSSPQVPN